MIQGASIVSIQPVSLPTALDGTGVSPSIVYKSFSQIVVDSVAGVEEKARTADAAARSFALGDSVPVHQVSYALEQARLSLELALQVRNRMLEGYQQLMNMQL